jgi:hypothetical protein
MTEYLPDRDPDPTDHDPPISVMRTEEIAPRGVPPTAATRSVEPTMSVNSTVASTRSDSGAERARLMPEALG